MESTRPRVFNRLAQRGGPFAVQARTADEITYRVERQVVINEG